ncbi:uncharacterized protein BYT42DRAFT_579316 [Radiomyces spectabilis]|uniref:uncharacterized protein n=1 Tax=Radiomyces spectabilis TaxID=64574 RepID=UPI00221E7A01|nr:uncharacterized protein BYT42DRAFT_579316 [Radiomyces spectabilis]KAI8373139.1 hypothetical protein BYT42DRAFT_579316 [Radiomyces spectabilis]
MLSIFTGQTPKKTRRYTLLALKMMTPIFFFIKKRIQVAQEKKKTRQVHFKQVASGYGRTCRFDQSFAFIFGCGYCSLLSLILIVSSV